MQYIIKSSDLKKLNEVIETLQEEHLKESDSVRQQNIKFALDFAEKILKNLDVTEAEIIEFHKKAEAILKLNKRSSAQAGPDMDQYALLSLLAILRDNKPEQMIEDHQVEFTVNNPTKQYTISEKEKNSTLKTEFFDVDVSPKTEKIEKTEPYPVKFTTHPTNNKYNVTVQDKKLISKSEDFDVEVQPAEQINTLTSIHHNEQQIKIKNITNNYYSTSNSFFYYANNTNTHVSTSQNHWITNNANFDVVTVELHLFLSIAFHLHESFKTVFEPIVSIPEAYQLAFIECGGNKTLSPEKPIEFGMLLSIALFLHELMEKVLKPVTQIVGNIIPAAYRIELIKQSTELPIAPVLQQEQQEVFTPAITAM